MSKALIINGADFSTNAVITISFNSVPCEGISFSTNTYSVTTTDEVTVEYTLTPSNTTDAVTWASSDTTVATVANGVITPVGLGTATITATCGEYTATATITVAITYIANWAFGNLGVGSGANFVTYTGTTLNRLSAFGSGSQAGTYTTNNTDYPVIKLPTNTTKIRISRGDSVASSFYNTNSAEVFWTLDESCGTSALEYAATYVSTSSAVNMVASASNEFEVPEGADSFVFRARLSTTYTADDNPATIASNLGLTIEFLTE